jgi:hypothetical protein
MSTIVRLSTIRDEYPLPEGARTTAIDQRHEKATHVNQRRGILQCVRFLTAVSRKRNETSHFRTSRCRDVIRGILMKR